MNKTIILAVQELVSKLLAGVISEQAYQNELDTLLELAPDNKTRQYVLSHKDRDI